MHPCKENVDLMTVQTLVTSQPSWQHTDDSRRQHHDTHPKAVDSRDDEFELMLKNDY
jgi:hypothetical protein